MTEAPIAKLEELHKLKEEKLLDIIRRVVANPKNAEEVAREIAQDWFPMCVVDAQGNADFVISGRKR